MNFLSQSPCVIHREGHYCYTNNGAIVYGYKITLPERYTLAEKDFDALHDLWYNALKDFDKGTVIHKQELFLKRKFERLKNDKTYLQKATNRHFNGRDFLEHHSFIFFILRTQAVFTKNIQNPFKKPVKKKELLDQINQEKNYADKVERAVDYLNNSRYFKLEPCSEEMFKFLEFGYFNGWYEDRFTDIETKKHTIGNKPYGVFALTKLKQMPSTVASCIYDGKMSSGEDKYYKGMIDSLGLDINCDHIVNQVIYIKDHKDEKDKIEDSRIKMYGARKFNKSYEHEAKKLEEYLEELEEDDRSRLVGFHLNVVYYADDAGQHQREIERMVSNEFKNIDITPYYPTGSNRNDLFFNSFFANSCNINSGNIIEPIDIQQVLCFLVNSSNYKNDDKGIYFNERIHNVPIIKDVWDENKKRIKARNFFVVAPTGEGKSVLANHIFRQMYEDDVRIVIIDLGDSYQKLNLLYPGETVYIKYQDGISLGLNPFLVDDPQNVNASQVDELATFVFKLWKRDRLPREDEAVSMRKILMLYYSTISSGHSFPQFYQFVEENKNEILNAAEIKKEFFDLEDFLHITSEFVGDGIYSFLFKDDQDSSFKIKDKKFIIFELDQVKDNHILLTIMLHLIQDAIQKVVWKDRSTKGIVFFDEFAKMLKFPSVLTTAEYFYQAARKQEAAIGTVLQSPSQLPVNDASNAIIDNTPVFYILPNEKGYEVVVDRFKLSEHDHIQLKSLKNNFSGKVKYSEFLLKIGSESNVIRLELPIEALYTYQSEGRVYEEIMSIYKKTQDMEKAVDTYISYHKN